MTSASSAPLDPNALQAELEEKVRILLQRERDVHQLVRRVNESNRWISVVAQIGSRIGACNSVREALAVLAESLAEALGFEFAYAQNGGCTEVCPPLPPAVASVMADTAQRVTSERVAAWSWTEGPVRTAFRIAIPAIIEGNSDVVVVVARTPRTAAYHVGHDAATPGRLARMSELLEQAFGAVHLRRDLLHERDSLQVAVAQATHELRGAVADAELARVAAVRAATARTEFLANMSHEIRTPMTAVLGYASLLLEGEVSAATQHEYLTTIVRSGRHLLGLLDDILNLARIESGYITAQNAPASIHDVMQEVHQLLVGTARDKHLTLRLEFQTALPNVANFDAPRLRQIVINLVGNALKFTERGEIAIIVAAQPAKLQIEVRDSGPGIPLEKRQAVFDAFEQVNQSNTRTHGGAGLGLAISRKLARLLDGDIQLHSELGVGSRFTATIGMTVPADAAWVQIGDNTAWPPPVVTPRTITPSAEPRTWAPGTQVLVVDDTRVNRALVTAYLQRLGLRVVEAEDGQQAVACVKEVVAAGGAFNLIFMDMQMPVMDGYEATRLIRLLAPQLPIVALTANSMASDRERCLAAGCSDYLAKPFDSTAITAMALRYVDDAQKADRADAAQGAGGVARGSSATIVTNAAVVDCAVAHLMPSFLATLRADLAELEAHPGRDAVVAVAHRLKGAAGTFGFATIADRAAALERLATKSEPAPDGQLLAALDALVEACRGTLTTADRSDLAGRHAHL